MLFRMHTLHHWELARNSLRITCQALPTGRNYLRMWYEVRVSRGSGARLIWERRDLRGKEAVVRARRDEHVYVAQEISQEHTWRINKGAHEGLNGN